MRWRQTTAVGAGLLASCLGGCSAGGASRVDLAGSDAARDGVVEGGTSDASGSDDASADRPTPDGALDAASDVTRDAGLEASGEADASDAALEPDGAPDATAAVDATLTDAGADAHAVTDAGSIDAAIDAPVDARVDAPIDAPIDTGPPDGGVDAAIPPPATFAPGQVDVVVDVLTASGRTPISPLIYGVNTSTTTALPTTVLESVTFTRRGGDRGNTYNWETNVSNGGIENGYVSDTTFGSPGAPASLDLGNLKANRAAGRATMVPFVLNDYVAGPVDSNIPWNEANFPIAQYFDRDVLVKPTPYATTPDLTDGVVYADEQLAYMRAQFADDITAPSPTQLLVGVDNEPDLWEYNFPMLQRGTGAALTSSTGVIVGHRVTGAEFTQRVIDFATRVKQVAPEAQVVGPAHFGYDGWECWHDPTQPQWSDLGHWFMDDFLTALAAASASAGVRLLDTWDFHWYPQATFNGTTVSALDDAVSPLTAAEVDAIVQGPRSYWDTTYDEGSWITSVYHLNGPASIVPRLQARLATGYPGTAIGVTEYFPGGRHHIASGLATVDTLGVFQRYGVKIAALWPLGDNAGLSYAFGGLALVHDADGQGLRFADTAVSVTNPDPVAVSVYGGMDTPSRVTVLALNKTTAALTVGMRLTNAGALARVSVYRIDAAHPSPYLAVAVPLSLFNAYAYPAPALSASLLVFETP